MDTRKQFLKEIKYGIQQIHSGVLHSASLMTDVYQLFQDLAQESRAWRASLENNATCCRLLYCPNSGSSSLEVIKVRYSREDTTALYLEHLDSSGRRNIVTASSVNTVHNTIKNAILDFCTRMRITEL